MLTELCRMRLVGRDHQPLDLSREDHHEIVKKEISEWMAGRKDNKDKVKYGSVNIKGIKLEPYGSPYGEVERIPNDARL